MPPEANATGAQAPDADALPAASVCPIAKPETLRHRRDFLSAARAGRRGTPTMNVQARERPEGEADGIRVGFTCSKKVGNAVARNRAKRRLRAVAREVLPLKGRDGWDYVLIGRAEVTGNAPFQSLLDDLTRALDTLHKARRG